MSNTTNCRSDKKLVNNATNFNHSYCFFLFEVTFVWVPYIGTIMFYCICKYSWCSIFHIFGLYYEELMHYAPTSNIYMNLLLLAKFSHTIRFFIIRLVIQQCVRNKIHGLFITNEELLRKKKDSRNTGVKKESDIQFGN